MKLLSILLVITCGLSSCVAMFARKNMHVTVRLRKGAGTLVYDTSYVGVKTRQGLVKFREGAEVPMVRKEGVVLRVKRDRHKLLPVTVTQDGKKKTVYLRPRVSGLYYTNLAHIFPLAAVGLLADMKNPNRFGYPRLVYLDMHDTTDGKYYTRKPLLRMVVPFRHSYWNVDVQPPLCNVNIFQPQNELAFGGLLGGNIAVNWHYHPHRFLAVTGGMAFFPGFMPGERFYTLGDTLYSNESKDWFAGLQQVHMLRHIELGYGIALWQFSGHAHYTIYPGHTEFDSKNYSHMALAANLSAYYFTNDVFSFGFSYRPQLISLAGRRSGNAYALNIGIRFRFPTIYAASGKR